MWFFGLFKRDKDQQPKGPKNIYRIYKTICPHCQHVRFGVTRSAHPINCKVCDKVICPGNVTFIGTLLSTSTVDALELAKKKYKKS